MLFFAGVVVAKTEDGFVVVLCGVDLTVADLGLGFAVATLSGDFIEATLAFGLAVGVAACAGPSVSAWRITRAIATLRNITV